MSNNLRSESVDIFENDKPPSDFLNRMIRRAKLRRPPSNSSDAKMADSSSVYNSPIGKEASYTPSDSESPSQDAVNKMIGGSLTSRQEVEEEEEEEEVGVRWSGDEEEEEADELGSSRASPKFNGLFSSGSEQGSPVRNAMDIDKENAAEHDEDAPAKDDNPYEHFTQEFIDLLRNTPSVGGEDDEDLPDANDLLIAASQPAKGKAGETKPCIPSTPLEVSRRTSLALGSPIRVQTSTSTPASTTGSQRKKNRKVSFSDDEYRDSTDVPSKRASPPALRKKTKKRVLIDSDDDEVIDLSTPPPPDRPSKPLSSVKPALSRSPMLSRNVYWSELPEDDLDLVPKKRRRTTGGAVSVTSDTVFKVPPPPRMRISASQPVANPIPENDSNQSVPTTEPPPPSNSTPIPTDTSELAPPCSNSQPPATVSQIPKPIVPRVHYRRHPEFWFLDGSIVLKLGNTVFRVHRSQMVSKSSFFAELLQKHSDEVMDGCPLYEIPTNVNCGVLDFARLLTADYNAFKYLGKSPAFPVLSSLLRASVALRFVDIQKWALNEFKKMWDPDVRAVKGIRPYPRESVVLARAVGGLADEVLKPAFYEIVKMQRLGMDVLDRDGDAIMGRKNGKDALDIDADDDDDGTFDTLGRQLTWNDIGKLVEAREQMVILWTGYALRPLPNCDVPIVIQAPNADAERDQPQPDGPKTQECGDVLRARWASLVHESEIFERYLHDPIGGLGELCRVSAGWEKDGIWCGSCAISNRQHWKKGKEKLWKALDLWLGLELGE